MNLLIRKARKHDKYAFQKLMTEHMESMYKVAKSILKNDDDVADAMQETALTCWEKIDTLREDKYFKTWLMRILINHCYAIYNQRKEMVSEDILLEWGFEDDGYVSAEWKEFLNCLDEKYRVVIILYYVEGFKTREIAELLQINESTIRSRLVSARKQMAERIEYESI